MNKFFRSRTLDKLYLSIEAIYITVTAYSLVLNFPLCVLLVKIALIFIAIVAITEIPTDIKKIKQRKEYDAHYNQK